MKQALLAATLLVALGANAQPTQAAEQPLPIPADSAFFASVRVSKLWDNPAAKPLRDWMTSQKGGTFDQIFGLAPAEIDRVTLFALTGDPREGGAPLVLVNTREPYQEVKLLKTLGADGAKGERTELGRIVPVNAVFRFVLLVDDRTLLYLPRHLEHQSLGQMTMARLVAPKRAGPLATAIAAASEHDVVIGIDLRQMDGYIRDLGLEKDMQFAPFASLLKSKTVTLTATLDKTAKIRLNLTFADADAAKQAEPVLEKAIQWLAETLSRENDQLPERFDPAEKTIVSWSIGALKSAKVTRDGASIVATVDVPFADSVAKFVAAMPKQLASARSDTRALNNLKQLALAMHNFESAYSFFPSDVYPAGDKSLEFSWRVQILPYIEQDNIYRQLNFTKSWDDPANLAILEKLEMPKVFEIPGRPAPKGQTYFRMFSLPKDAKGKDRPWLIQGERGPKIADITDGTSNTFMIVEAGEAVPWYKPDVLAYDGKLPLPQLGDKEVDRFLVALGDGSVKSLRASKMSEKTLRALITIQNGEVVELPK